MKERKVVVKLLGTPSLNVDSNAIVMVRGGKEREEKLVGERFFQGDLNRRTQYVQASCGTARAVCA